MKDEWGIVLDFLPKGRVGSIRQEPLAQVIGERYFSLLEVVLRAGVKLSPEERIYIGDGKRKKVKYIKKSVNITNLTAGSKAELEGVIEKLVRKSEPRFVRFFNDAGSLTTRMHQLEILPGIGKKRLWEIIAERKKSKFTSYEDIKRRLPLLPDPVKMITARIMQELEPGERHHLFTLPRRERR